MESVSGSNSGREVGKTPRPASFVARMTAPLRAAMAGHYQDRYAWDGAAQEIRSGNVPVIISSIWNGLKTSWNWVKTKANDAWTWVGDKVRSFNVWLTSALSKAFGVFRRTEAEEAKRRQEELAYEKKYQEKKDFERRDTEKRDEARRVEDSTQARVQMARRQAASDAAAVAFLATDRVKAPPPGAEKHQIVDNGTLERRRLRRMLTGTLPA
ncbi:MAG: hypothetical protein FJZ00_04140 [Candidatus Sericytochromatia bacterium]|uniref:Uncharacterized protein n=1 Tax=Candidatus Tanganyikabacteria bacterium TaxID=2961651 RepID=A0A937X4Q4_9BACT|nr:hypothetical protein [Candidatus Tanganyikabacteria bacterium]